MKKLPEAVRDWLRFAEEDLESAKVLLKEGIYNQSCFHSQQCAEKILKAWLLLQGKRLPKIHDLNELLEKSVQAGLVSFIQFRKKIEFLSLFYVPTRYPDAAVGTLPHGLPNEKDAKEALQTATDLYQSATKFLEK